MEPHSVERIESQNQISQPEKPSRGTSFFRTCFNGVNALSGVGILSVPYALSEGGWLCLMILFLVAIVCCYTGFLLQRCMSVSLTIKTYPGIGEFAFGNKGRAVISIFMYLELYLVVVEFLILEGENLQKLFPNANFCVGSLKIVGREVFVFLVALIILPPTWLKSLGLVAYVFAGGVLASIILVGAMFWAGEVDNIFLLLFFILSTITYGSMATMGYLMYGENLMSQVTLNLPTRKISLKIAIYTTLINPITKYTLVVSPIATVIEDTFSFRKSKPMSYFIKTVLVISTIIVALAVPYFGYVMTFIGAFLGVSVSILFPCLCYLKIKKPYSRNFGIEVIFIGMILILGTCVSICETYISLKNIMKHVQQK
ncbi:amino acid transporter AVT1I-like [Nicotiana tomentosiformis]|uniref:amino acid transporter AVT1I-like n=1 Tax=Nicotiana tomentosiformis TaxID=4098 RepID=UPI00388C3ABF